jgi:dihydroorotase
MPEILLPGFCDLGCAFGEPGSEQAETIRSGLAAAARGGWSVVAMEPFTDPPIDTDAQIQLVRHLAEGSPCRLVPLAAATREKGALSEMALLRGGGCGGCLAGRRPAGFGGVPAVRPGIRRPERSHRVPAPVRPHPRRGRDGPRGTRVRKARAAGNPLARRGDRAGDRAAPGPAHGRKGPPVPSVHRAGRLHGPGSRLEGLPVTADVSFRHLLQDESILEGFPSEWKLFPPLRSESDKRALWQGLLDGTWTRSAPSTVRCPRRRNLRNSTSPPTGP